MADGEVVFQIKADSKDASKALDDFVKQARDAGMDIDKAMADAGKSAEKSFDGMGDAFSKAFDVERLKNFAIDAAKQVVQFGKEAIQAASDLEEVQNVVDTTFGDSASTINTWAQNAAKNFGLTETQAKRFTSTLGAMMKSAGLAGPEITQMSTDLAGLAADMASFYNLDFDTAFQKIRSGISGETEPLKQLGINMSAANLEAFALSQGLGKTYSTMSQGEQVVLRYQYLMQATADAQGDFARTSDGYANSMRMLETNIEQFKTNAGKALLPVVTNVINTMNQIFEAMQQDLPKETVLDKFAQIDLNTEKKIAEIQNTANEAYATVEVLNKITGFTGSTEALTAFVESFSGAISDLSVPIEAAQTGNYAATIQSLSESLTSIKPGTTADDWLKLLSGVSAAISGVKIDTSGVTAPIEAAKAAVEDTDISTDNLTRELESVGKAAETVSAPAMPVVDAVVNIQSEIDKPIDTTKLDENLGKISTAVAKAPPSDQGTIIQVLEGVSGALSSAAFQINTNGETFTSYLEVAADAANKLGPEAAAAWGTLVDSLGSEVAEDMLAHFAEAGTAVDNVTTLLNSLGGFQGDGSGIATAVENLAALGINVENQEEALGVWLDLCQRLVNTLPALSKIINTQTGEVEGGMQAVFDYINAWEQAQKSLVIIDAAQAKLAALDESMNLTSLEIDLRVAEKTLSRIKQQFSELGGWTLFDEFFNDNGLAIKPLTEDAQKLLAVWLQMNQAQNDLNALQEEYGRQTEANEAALNQVESLNEVIADETAKLKENQTVVESMATTYESFSADAAESVKSIISDMAPVLEEMVSMYESTREQIASSVESMFDGFDFKMPELKPDKMPTAEDMFGSLTDQIEYMNQYMALLDELRGKGVSSEVLGNLSSGSTEDFAYLQGLANASKEEIEAINAAYEEAKQKREEFTDSLTASTLAGDETWNELQTQVNDGMAGLTEALGDTSAVDAADSTMSGILDAVKSRVGEIETEIDRVVSAWAKLEGVGLRGFSPSRSSGSSGSAPHAGGLDYVPYNGYLARLHEGESVLTREESRAWRGLGQGAQNASALDYSALGNVIRDNAPKAGGNVYLNGQTVGRVISDGQANDYRMLERSGWQG